MSEKISCKKLIQAIVVVVIALMASDFLIHQVLLKSLYQSTAHLWRSVEEMQQFLKFMLLGQLGVTVFFVWIFAHGYRGTGWKEGLRYGLLMAGFGASNLLVMFSVAPYTTDILISWVIAGFAQSVLLGVLASLVYKPV